MIKLGAELTKQLRVNRIGRFLSHGATKNTYFACDRWKYFEPQCVMVKRFATQNVLPTSASAPAPGSTPQPTPSSAGAEGDENKTSQEEEIYSGPLSKRIRFLKIMTLATSFGTLFILKDMHDRIEFANQAVMVAGVGVVLLFSFLTPFLINLISKKYCVKMYYDHSKKRYIAHIYTFMFKKKKIEFTPDDVVVPKVNKFFAVAYVKNHPMFFDADHFKTIDYYKNIMGYDKPIDFRLDKKDEK